MINPTFEGRIQNSLLLADFGLQSPVAYKVADGLSTTREECSFLPPVIVRGNCNKAYSANKWAGTGAP